MRTFDGKFIEFPLSCLSYPTDKMESILAFCIMKEARKIKYLHKNNAKGINEEYFPQDFDKNDKWCLLITIAAFNLRIKIKSYARIKELGSAINIYVNNYTEKYGDDAYCRIGKNLFVDTMNKRFDYKQFTVLCAINSIIGKQSEYKRITKDKILYRMLGYKSKEIFCSEYKLDVRLLTRRQLERIINSLHEKNFFGKFTYAKRISYYSTKLDDEQLRKRVLQNKLKTEKHKLNDYDNEYSILIKNQITLLKKQHKLKMCFKGAHYGSLN
jgi:hypothetical protein